MGSRGDGCGHRLPGRLAVAVGLAALLVFGLGGAREQPSLGDGAWGRPSLVVYFSTADAGALVGERYWIAPAQNTPEHALALLLRGPVSPALVAPLPEGVRLLDVQVRDGVAWANFSGELVEAHSGGTAGEAVTVYAIVNTLTEGWGVRRVRILVDGRPVESLAGHIDLQMALERDPAFIAGVVIPPWQAGPPEPAHPTGDGPGRPGWPWWPPAPR